MIKTLEDVKAEMLAKATGHVEQPLLLASNGDATESETETGGRPLGKYSIFNRNGNVLAHAETPFEHIYTDAEDLAWAKAQGYSWRTETLDDGRVLTFVKAQLSPDGMYKSEDGKFYTEDNLPEQTDAFVIERYTAKQKAERDARLRDTDDYERLPDITVQRAEGGKRSALTDDEKAEVKIYRMALRDFPEQEGFPFAEFPTIPDCIAYEVGLKIAQRKEQEAMYGNF